MYGWLYFQKGDIVLFECYNDYYENYMLNDGVYNYTLSDKDKEVLDEAIWLIDNKVSIRKVCNEFGKSKSTIHRDLSIKLNNISSELYVCVKRQLNKNKAKYFRY